MSIAWNQNIGSETVGNFMSEETVYEGKWM